MLELKSYEYIITIYEGRGMENEIGEYSFFSLVKGMQTLSKEFIVPKRFLLSHISELLFRELFNAFREKKGNV